ncbi:28002_t:CDS:2 [Racocetra persica]|uniref:28002_t:CDS:1 n=1 Tax=Racocetra persica TaxID=160502 RepID=A0ACA9K859_9GLOM|nr:28002_t:CDS:2 [Racocetra persica]
MCIKNNADSQFMGFNVMFEGMLFGSRIGKRQPIEAHFIPEKAFEEASKLSIEMQFEN